ncbi:DNA-binding response regulator, OmpR family, contains REC and winged-helix (wHTH) domain [Pseudoxanthomonas sp. GM95]|uniref:response regulator transcription factor n=1 Tax=Pseudoxanthomonas sp. GM95 TaxID=1881043 RepID=UPI0008CC7E44|nr:response regulator transcription factor [Pseudoxanthomonas sp. GM95]SEL57851.1 DNA-binding response regulator, OmpR family, contains REC and winged-helix (wHTH) domain [Pseudoxanthomonas sp. GM95]
MTDTAPAIATRVALIEDHPRLAGLIERGLASAGIAVDVFQTLESAWHGLSGQGYAVAIVDRGMPDGDGLDLVRRLRRADVRTPCLMLTSRDALRDRVDGLDAGADDYLPKPFALDELAARVRALMRRPTALRSVAPSFLGLSVEPESGSMLAGQERISLAPAELQLMLALLRAQGQTVRRTALENAAWGAGGAVTPNALDVAIHRLRKKLVAIEAAVGLVNVRQQGFALRAADASA